MQLFDVVLIIITIGVFVIGLIAIKKVINEGFIQKWNLVTAIVFGLLFVSYLIYNIVIHGIDSTGWAQIFLTSGLIVVSGLYALVSYRQANANVKMADEVREQRIMASRPVIIQKAVYSPAWKPIDGEDFESNPKYFSYFEVRNVGNGPAIELEISLKNKADPPLKSHRESFLQPGDSIKFHLSDPSCLNEDITYYLACEYQSIFSRGAQKPWYQTLLPFKPVRSSKEGKIFLVAGELEFCDVTEKERIDAFASGSKPK